MGVAHINIHYIRLDVKDFMKIHVCLKSMFAKPIYNLLIFLIFSRKYLKIAKIDKSVFADKLFICVSIDLYVDC